ncbi:hypothetical protein [Fibrella aquatilis]|uniref:Guanylate cyclase domain-containing protein n=1 Tax=Fibrella aquatilis TaxID=2817059 RepID=A0A939GDR4_9BACT|nr:hypothetical protein [Fibrella aquatilis]MBO0934836.1 hypothetical protein [Fibrella aquatilis]
MGIFTIENEDRLTKVIEGTGASLIKGSKYASFDTKVLGLGNLSQESKPMNAIAAIFDLEGFTNFCQQVDPHLAVPEYLSLFLDWLFEEIREGIKHSEIEGDIVTYADLPLLSKFLGDGVLFLWNTDNMRPVALSNIIFQLKYICIAYFEEFLPSIKNDITTPPLRLRCGVARGIVYSVGNGQDFVGPCINMASRLQKIESLSFCFARRGID